MKRNLVVSKHLLGFTLFTPAYGPESRDESPMKSAIAYNVCNTHIFRSACLGAATLLCVQTFQWSLVDSLTPFLALPLVGFVWLVMIFIMVWSVFHAYKQRRVGRRALFPFVICICTFLLSTFVPFTRIWIEANFYLKKAEREAVVTRVLSGELLPNVSHNPKTHCPFQRNKSVNWWQ